MTEALPETTALPPGHNRLGDETSPYLLQHKNNPVQWWAWGPEALEMARAADRPILLSIGYSACHWCHVMAHESFEDPAVAALMNKYFVNIKVDREERPDLDAIYQKALSLMGEHGGWPLTMFIRPDGRPFWGGTYFPPQPAYGRPSFTEVLTQIDRVWREMRDEVDKQSATLVAEIGKQPREQLRDGLSMSVLDDAAVSLLEYVDADYGGLKGAPKFPMPFVYDFLWRMAARSDHAEMREAVLKTVHGLCEGGIYDHVGGGFARYSTDETWLVPHFEKMLYDNAQLIDLMTLVWRDTREPVLAARITETIEWLIAEMTADNDAFAAALDADSEDAEGNHEEGAFYVWSDAELDQALGADAAEFRSAYGVIPGGNWEGHHILNRSAFPFGSGDEEKLEHCRDVLLQVRENRHRPGRDDKALADWNGLAIAALARAGTMFNRRLWKEAANRAFAAVCKTMTWQDDQGRARLGHAWCAGRLQKTAMLDDYANMINAALALYEATSEKNFLIRAEEWAATAVALYWDESTGGYFFTAADAETLIVRTKTANDSATPSGNGAMAMALARLFYITGNADYRTRAGATVAALSMDALRAFPHAAVVLSAFVMLEEGVQVIILGHPDARETFAMIMAAHGAPEPNVIVSVVADTTGLPASHPAFGKTRVDGNVTAYICRGPVCEAPVTTAADLTAALV